jgi:uncharacterized OB-fold protein
MTEPIAAAPFTVASFDQFLRQNKLMASRCTRCRALHLPPRAICPECHGDQLEWVEASGKGKLVAFTIIYVGPSAMIAEGFDRKNPYCSGIVQLDEGVRISARITGVDAQHPDSIRIGMPLSAEFLDHGEERGTQLAFRAA